MSDAVDVIEPTVKGQQQLTPIFTPIKCIMDSNFGRKLNLFEENMQ